MATPPVPDPDSAESLALRHEMSVATQGVILSQVARLIAHDINQPLAAIAANGGACLRWLRRDPPESEEAAAAVQRILADTRRAAEGIRGIQAFLERQALARAPESLPVLFGAALQLVAPVAASRNVQLILEPVERLPPVAVNRAQMLHVLHSLLCNACESVERVPEPRVVRLAAALREAEVEVSVHDNGPGLGTTGRERHFEAFYTSKPQGLGLGLAVSRSIVESHGGRLWATPNEGEGETFRFTLPLRA
jgi:C4-dicarboxylate-specific signal transduction histidine kinase